MRALAFCETQQFDFARLRFISRLHGFAFRRPENLDSDTEQGLAAKVDNMMIRP